MREAIRHATMMILFGLVMGVASKWMDHYTFWLGMVFSELSIWVLIGAWIAIINHSAIGAMVDNVLFFVSMLIGYYGAAIWMHGVYGRAYIIGWSMVALFAVPPFAYLAWYSRTKRRYAHVAAFVIVIGTLIASMRLFDGPRLRDGFIVLVLGYMLYRRDDGE